MKPPKVYTEADVPLPWSGPGFNQNYKRSCKRGGETDQPCCICGRRIVATDPVMLLIGHGNTRFVRPDDQQPADAGGYPIGPCCLRKYPALRALGYVPAKETT